ncbi:hypothetical protein [Listeria costaricensis]|uniref:hypothetical protein n=1 Tax=Listeria costaricensis TaxID=2026604 RepID=UPI000C07ADC7|nr:hypothetical protein [Listeria costaricensis]
MEILLRNNSFDRADEHSYEWVELPATEERIAEIFNTTKKCEYVVLAYDNAPFNILGYSLEDMNVIASLAREKEAYWGYFIYLDEAIAQGFYEDLIHALTEIEKMENFLGVDQV